MKIYGHQKNKRMDAPFRSHCITRHNYLSMLIHGQVGLLYII